MYAPAFVQDSVLIRVVARSRADQLVYQGGLAAVTQTGNQNRAIFPTNDSGMNKDAARRMFGDGQLHMRFKGLEHVVKISGPSKPEQVPIAKTKTAHSRLALPAATDD